MILGRPVVMVVEDDVEMNELERELLSVHGMDAVAAYNGLEAMEVARRTNVDAVLLDIMLPELDGLEACRRLRGRNGRKVAIIIITALDCESARRLGDEAGADAYFVKPFDPDEVMRTVRRLIELDHRRPT